MAAGEGAGGEPVGEVAAVFTKPRKGRPVVPAARLECRPGVGIVGDANAAPDSSRQVLLVSGEVEANLGLGAGALWENVTTTGIDVDACASGTVLLVGDTAAIAVTGECEPCSVIATATGVPVRRLLGRRGVVGMVVTAGTIAAGDPVRALPRRLPPLPGPLFDRCRLVVGRIPPGRVLTHDELVAAVGGARSLSRSLPRWLSRLAAEGLPAHRVVASTDRALEPDQEHRLREEGAALHEGRVLALPPWWPTDPVWGEVGAGESEPAPGEAGEGSGGASAERR